MAAGVRVEAAFDRAGEVSAFYDPMIAKLVAHGPDRVAALRTLTDALRATAVVGLTTNLGFLGDLLRDRRVVAGRLDTHLVDGFVAEADRVERAWRAAACAAAMEVPPCPAVRPRRGTAPPARSTGARWTRSRRSAGW
ncbi:hypothetical protein ACFQ1I_38400 [Kitasatospora arboriphila]